VSAAAAGAGSGLPLRKRLLFAAATLLLALLAAEGALRLLWGGFYVKAGVNKTRRSRALGWENMPGIAFVDGAPEYAPTVTHGASGFRGGDPPAAKPAGRFRLVVLGDSFTYGAGVGDEETFCARLEREEPRLEVVNAGVQGYCTAQHVVALERRAAPLAPDAALVVLFWNDVQGSFEATDLGFSLGADGALRHVPPDESVPPPPPRPRSTSHRLLLRHSYLYRFTSDRLRVALTRAGVTGRLLALEDEGPAWALHDALLGELARRARRLGIPLVVAILPDQVQVEPGARVSGLEPRHVEVQARMSASAAAHGIPLVDLLPGLVEERKAAGAPLYYAWDRHLNARGHAALARLLAPALARLGLPPRARPEESR
jgi:lysophospholipase L1-like esterase